MRDDESTWRNQADGIRQGSPLSSYFFCLFTIVIMAALFSDICRALDGIFFSWEGLHCIDWGVGFTVIEYPSFQGPDLFDRRVPGNTKSYKIYAYRKSCWILGVHNPWFLPQLDRYWWNTPVRLEWYKIKWGPNVQARLVGQADSELDPEKSLAGGTTGAEVGSPVITD